MLLTTAQQEKASTVTLHIYIQQMIFNYIGSSNPQVFLTQKMISSKHHRIHIQQWPTLGLMLFFKAVLPIPKKIISTCTIIMLECKYTPIVYYHDP